MQRTYSESGKFYAMVYSATARAYWMRGPFTSRSSARRYAIRHSD